MGPPMLYRQPHHAFLAVGAGRGLRRYTTIDASERDPRARAASTHAPGELGGHDGVGATTSP